MQDKALAETLAATHTEVRSQASLPLHPIKSALADRLIASDELLRELLRGLGSPINILLPGQLAANVAGFRRVLAEHRLQGQIFFAHKSNQSHSLLAELATLSVGVDVASMEELKHALAAGFVGNRMEATGPKSAAFIALCLQHDVVVNVNSMQELEDLCRIRHALSIAGKARVLLRLSGFNAGHTTVLSKPSRFGIRFADIDTALDMVAASEGVELLGFSFHLDSVGLDDRLVAIEACLEAIERSIALGLEPRVLNIGGGFKVNYLQSEDEWNAYTSALTEAVLGKRPPLTWHTSGFGLSADGGRLRGKLNTYGYFEPAPGPHFLEALLTSELPGFHNQKVADALRDNMIELFIEPGRALIDQCGVTVARVESVGSTSAGDVLVGLGMKRQDVAFLDQEIFADPVIIGKKKGGGGTAVYFAGNLCLESDLIFRRQVFLDAVPEPGDLVVFVNTAAYMMDFSATRSIMQPLARKVAVVEDGAQLSWMLDELYSPVWRLNR